MSVLLNTKKTEIVHLVHLLSVCKIIVIFVLWCFFVGFYFTTSFISCWFIGCNCNFFLFQHLIITEAIIKFNREINDFVCHKCWGISCKQIIMMMMIIISVDIRIIDNFYERYNFH